MPLQVVRRNLPAFLYRLTVRNGGESQRTGGKHTCHATKYGPQRPVKTDPTNIGLQTECPAAAKTYP